MAEEQKSILGKFFDNFTTEGIKLTEEKNNAMREIRAYNDLARKLNLRDANGNTIKKNIEDIFVEGQNKIDVVKRDKLVMEKEQLRKFYYSYKEKEALILEKQKSHQLRETTYEDIPKQEEKIELKAIEFKAEQDLLKLRNEARSGELTDWSIYQKVKNKEVITDLDKKLFKMNTGGPENGIDFTPEVLAQYQAAVDKEANDVNISINRISERIAGENAPKLPVTINVEAKPEETAEVVEGAPGEEQTTAKVVTGGGNVPRGTITEGNKPAQAPIKEEDKEDPNAITANEADILSYLPDSLTPEQRKQALDKFREKATGKRAEEHIAADNVNRQVKDTELTPEEIRAGKTQFDVSDGKGNELKKDTISPFVAKVLFGKGGSEDVAAYNNKRRIENEAKGIKDDSWQTAYADDAKAGKLPSQEKQVLKKNQEMVDAVDENGKAIKVAKGVYTKGATLVDPIGVKQEITQGEQRVLDEDELTKLDAAYDRQGTSQAGEKDKANLDYATNKLGYKRERPKPEKPNIWSEITNKK